MTMWQFFKHQQTEYIEQREPSRRPLDFDEIVAGMSDFSDLAKHDAALKIWLPTRLKTDLKTLAEHVGLTPSNYVREILISRLLGHGMLPQRPSNVQAISCP